MYVDLRGGGSALFSVPEVGQAELQLLAGSVPGDVVGGRSPIELNTTTQHITLGHTNHPNTPQGTTNPDVCESCFSKTCDANISSDAKALYQCSQFTV